MKRILSLTMGVVLISALGCSDDSQPSRAGFESDADYQARALDYLEFATAGQPETGSVPNAIAYMERDQVDPSFTAPTGGVGVDDWSPFWEKLDKLLDSRDFEALEMLNALLRYEDHPYLTPALWDRIRSTLFEFKFWFQDATPAVPDPDNPERDWDDSFYWSENHQIIFHTIEYLMGQRYPDRCFTIRGFTATDDCTGTTEVTVYGETEVRAYEHRGRALHERARANILAWLDDRWLAGFSEWHSNVYLELDAKSLLTLVEHADDQEIRTRAAMMLDVLMLDMATTTRRGVLGVTHGRSAMKNKHRGPANLTWGIVTMFFDQAQEYGYQSLNDGAALFAQAKRYRLPLVVLEIARGDETFVGKTRQSFPIDETNPGDPTPPPGKSFDTDPETIDENFTFWWGLEAWTAWQVIPLTATNADRYNLWNTSLLQPFSPLRALLGDPPEFEQGVSIARSIWPALALGLLKEVNTYTYRTSDYILSTAQDYRKGANAGEIHSWQATFSSEALVFTTHPMQVPPENQLPSVWLFEDEGDPGYWTGTASQPRSAQHENLGIHIYSPVYPSAPLSGFGVDAFTYEEFTHAYFPRDHFDEWAQAGSWTFGRRDDGYVALYSWRPTEWRDIPPDELALMPESTANDSGPMPITQSFDLVAPDGPDNVWIVECGSEDQYGDFGAFRNAISNASVVVTPRPTDVPNLSYQQFDVSYDSPSQGLVTFGWNTPLTVDGTTIEIDAYPRIDNPWVIAERGAEALVVEGNTSSLLLDWARPSRTGSEVQ